MPSGEAAPSGVSAAAMVADEAGRLLSVAEIQQALRELRARRPASSATVLTAPPHPSDRSPGGARPPTSRPVATGHRPVPGEDGTAARPGGDGSTLPVGCVVVLAAHAGAGASTVALALSDAAAADRRVHLVETAPPARSGLVAAASAELGSDATGGWRRGRRGGITIDRRAADIAPAGWPTPPAGAGPAVTILDLGLPTADELTRLATADVRAVVVCRATVPGVRLTEQLLGRLTGPQVVVTVGPRRWPGPVTAGLGPRLRALRAAGRVLTIPVDPRLEVTGPTGSPLPRPVLAPGRALLALLEAERPQDAPAPSGPVTKGSGR